MKTIIFQGCGEDRAPKIEAVKGIRNELCNHGGCSLGVIVRALRLGVIDVPDECAELIALVLHDNGFDSDFVPLSVEETSALRREIIINDYRARLVAAETEISVCREELKKLGEPVLHNGRLIP